MVAEFSWTGRINHGGSTALEAIQPRGVLIADLNTTRKYGDY